MPRVDLSIRVQDTRGLKLVSSIHRVGVLDLSVYLSGVNAKGCLANIIVTVEGVESLCHKSTLEL